MHSRRLNNLGKGGFSDVILEKHKGQLYACKQIKLPIQQSLSYILDQLNALRCLHHPNIARIFGFRLHSFSTFDIYLQYIQGQTIDQSYTQTDEEILFYWIFQISLALIHLKSKGIVHRDLKPKNILVNEKGLIKIIDLGMGKILCNKKSKIVGSPLYISPQIIKSNYVDHSSDVWSLGITIYELIHRHLPFNFIQNNLEEELLFCDRICNERIQINRGKCSSEMAQLLELMLNTNPKKRITVEAILSYGAIKCREKIYSTWYTKALQQC